jgi:hypothetical protein
MYVILEPQDRVSSVRSFQDVTFLPQYLLSGESESLEELKGISERTTFRYSSTCLCSPHQRAQK